MCSHLTCENTVLQKLMAPTEREIVFTNDLDGVHFKTLPPLKNTLRLLRKNMKLPEVDSPIGQYNLPEGWRGVLFSRWSIFLYSLSPVNKDALQGLEMFRQVAKKNERQLKFAALSGREIYKHPMTHQRLEKSGHMKYFSDLYLNQGRSASGWKESVVRRLTQEGLNVVHIDDDLKAGLMVARVNDDYPHEQRVLVYMIHNVSNHPRLLTHAQVKVPNNLLFVHSFKEAAMDFVSRLNNKTI